jgi:hypothetical protein
MDMIQSDPPMARDDFRLSNWLLMSIKNTNKAGKRLTISLLREFDTNIMLFEN